MREHAAQHVLNVPQVCGDYPKEDTGQDLEGELLYGCMYLCHLSPRTHAPMLSDYAKLV